MSTYFIVSYNGVSNVGGVERVCFYVRDILVKNNCDVKIIDKKIFPIPLGHRFSILLFPFIVWLYLCFQKKEEDIVISNSYMAFGVCTDFLFMHGTTAGINSAFGRKRKGFFAYLEKLAVIRAKKILAVSLLTKCEIIEHYGISESKIIVLNNPVDSDIFYPIRGKKYCNKVVLFCGRLEERKGLSKVLYLSDVLEERSDYKFIIATPSESVATLFLQRKNTIVLNSVPLQQLNEFYNSGGVLYFPSRYEGFEMITLEALSSGVPVLGFPVGAVKELFDRKEPGVEIIRENELLSQLDSLINVYSSSKKREELHAYYKQNYGLELYMNKLLKILLGNERD